MPQRIDLIQADLEAVIAIYGFQMNTVVVTRFDPAAAQKVYREVYCCSAFVE
jgi:hypothetical protein